MRYNTRSIQTMRCNILTIIMAMLTFLLVGIAQYKVTLNTSEEASQVEIENVLTISFNQQLNILVSCFVHPLHIAHSAAD